jgi:hypothetical protein
VKSSRNPEFGKPRMQHDIRTNLRETGFVDWRWKEGAQRQVKCGSLLLLLLSFGVVVLLRFITIEL